MATPDIEPARELADRLLADHRLDQEQVGRAVVGKLAPLWKIIEPTSVDSSATVWVEAAVPVIEEGFRESQVVADRFVRDYRQAMVPAAEPLVDVDFDEFPANRTRVSVIVTGPVEVKRKLPAPDALDKGFVGSSGAAVRIVGNGGREAVEDLVEMDAEAIGYARKTDSRPCYFCAMLASRGAVYKKDSFELANNRFAGEGVAKTHDNCQCTLRPVYDEDDDLDEEGEEFWRIWEESTEGLSGAEERKAFRRAYENRDRPEPQGPADVPISTLERVRRDLIDAGFAADSFQVQFYDRQIERFGGESSRNEQKSSSGRDARLQAEADYRRSVDDWLRAENRYRSDVESWLAAETGENTQNWLAAEANYYAEVERATADAARIDPAIITRSEGREAAHAIWHDYADQLPAEQRAGVLEYTGNGYEGINVGLRGTGGATAGEFNHLGDAARAKMFDHIAAIDKAIENAPRIPEAVRVSREIRGDVFGIPDQNLLKDTETAKAQRLASAIALVGETTKDDAFMSTTMQSKLDVIAHNSIEVLIDLPAGTPALYVSSHARVKGVNDPKGLAAFGPDENELVLPRGVELEFYASEESFNGSLQGITLFARLVAITPMALGGE